MERDTRIGLLCIAAAILPYAAALLLPAVGCYNGACQVAYVPIAILSLASAPLVVAGLVFLRNNAIAMGLLAVVGVPVLLVGLFFVGAVALGLATSQCDGSLDAIGCSFGLGIGLYLAALGVGLMVPAFLRWRRRRPAAPPPPRLVDARKQRWPPRRRPG